MSLFSEFSALSPYLQSVRKLKNYISFDVSIPNTWKLPKKYVQEDKILEQTSTIENYRLISFVSEIKEEEVEVLTSNIQKIIEYNIEREEKEKLLEIKVNELRALFEKTTLNSLKNLKFEIKQSKIQLQDDEPSVKTPKLVE